MPLEMLGTEVRFVAMRAREPPIGDVGKGQWVTEVVPRRAGPD